MRGKPKYTINTVIDFVTKKNGLLLSKEYRIINDIITIQCNNCGYVWGSRFADILRNHWCANCLGKVKYTIEYVRDEIEKRNGILLSCNYIRSSLPLNVKCNVCDNIWHPSFINILSGKWCPVCAISAKRYSIDFIRSEIEKRDGILLSNQYINSSKPIDIQCNKCKTIWRPALSDVLRGSWCPLCKNKSEQKLFNVVQKIYPVYNVINQFNDFDWLINKKTNHKQRFDIFVVELKLAIEYDGKQHFSPVRFGGISEERAIEVFNYIKEMDIIKNTKVVEHPDDVKYFIRIPYTEKIDIDNITNILNSYLKPTEGINYDI